MEYRGKRYIRQRTAKDIWQRLFEFPLIGSSKRLSPAAVLKQAEKNGLLKKNSYRLLKTSPEQQQQLTHQKIRGKFFHLQLSRKPGFPDAIAVSGAQLTRYAFPRFINNYLYPSR
jgi:A/G-specific adenine glycosylase